MEAAPWIWLASAVTGAAGLALLLWALFSDRARRRRRCPRCWYDMGAVEGLLCPECGHDARRVRRLLKTRRRWKPAAAAVAALAASGALALTPHVREHGPLSLAPTHMLALILPREAGERIHYRTSTSVPQYQLAAARELIRRGGASAVPASMWPRVLLRTGMIDPPRSWIEGVPVPVRLNAVGWAPRLEMHVRAGPDDRNRGVAGRTIFQEVIATYTTHADRGALQVEPLSLGTHMVRYEVQIEVDAGASEAVLWQGTVSSPIRIEPASEQRLEPVYDRWIEDAIATGTVYPSIVPDPLSVSFWFDTRSWPDPDHLWLELHAEILANGRSIPMQGLMAPDPTLRDYNLFSLDSRFTCEPGAAPVSLDGVVLRLRGVPPSCPEGMRAGQYWAGHVDFAAKQVREGTLYLERIFDPDAAAD